MPNVLIETRMNEKQGSTMYKNEKCVSSEVITNWMQSICLGDWLNNTVSIVFGWTPLQSWCASYILLSTKDNGDLMVIGWRSLVSSIAHLRRYGPAWTIYTWLSARVTFRTASDMLPVIQSSAVKAIPLTPAFTFDQDSSVRFKKGEYGWKI